MYATEVGKELPNNYSLSTYNASVQVYKHGIRQNALLALKIANVGP